MSPDSTLVDAVDTGGPSVPALAAAGGLLCLGAALCYGLLRLGYVGGHVAAGTYGTLSSALVWASLLLGVGSAAVCGYVGEPAAVGVLVGVAPTAGVAAGSAVTAGAGPGRYDASPVALVAGLLAVCGVACALAWAVGRAARRGTV